MVSLRVLFVDAAFKCFIYITLLKCICMNCNIDIWNFQFAFCYNIWYTCGGWKKSDKTPRRHVLCSKEL